MVCATDHLQVNWRDYCFIQRMNEALHIVVVAPDLVVKDQSDVHAISQAERSRSLRIGLLSNGFMSIPAAHAGRR